VLVDSCMLVFRSADLRRVRFCGRAWLSMDRAIRQTVVSGCMVHNERLYLPINELRSDQARELRGHTTLLGAG
jgi:hypothetical protein